MNFTKTESFAILRVLMEIADADKYLHQDELEILASARITLGITENDIPHVINMEFEDTVNILKLMSETKKDDVALAIKELIYVDLEIHDAENAIVEYLRVNAQINPYYMI